MPIGKHVHPLSLFRLRRAGHAEADRAFEALRASGLLDAAATRLLDKLEAGDPAAGRTLARKLRQQDDVGGAWRPCAIGTVLWLTGRCGFQLYGARAGATSAVKHESAFALIELLALAKGRLERARADCRIWGDERTDPQAMDDALMVTLARRELATAWRRVNALIDQEDWGGAAEAAVAFLVRPAEAVPEAPSATSQEDKAAIEQRSLPGSIVPCPGLAEQLQSQSSSEKRRLLPLAALASPMLRANPPADLAPQLDAVANGMPNFAAVVSVLRQVSALHRYAGRTSVGFRPILLVGEPGVGKTRFASALAAALGLPFGRLSLGGMADNRTLAGTASGWSTSEVCWPVRQLVTLQRVNPILMLDELDKCTASHNGDPLATLLDWLEPSTARAVVDPQLNLPVDISHISWVLAANRIGHLPAPLLSRVRVMQIGPLPADSFAEILRSVLRDLALELGLGGSDELPPLAPEDVAWLQRNWKCNPRLLGKLVARVSALSAERTFERVQ